MLRRRTAGPGTMQKAEFFLCKLPNQQALSTIHKGATNKLFWPLNLCVWKKKTAFL